MHILNSQLLNSQWLIKMLEKSSQTPHGRLLSVFDILEDWLDAPNVALTIREQIGEPIYSPKQAKILQDYLTLEAAKAGAAMPEVLANQLYFMVIAATQEKLQANNPASLSQAKKAARALISAQTKKDFYIAKPSAYAIAASFMGLLVVAGGLYLFNQTPNRHTSPMALNQTYQLNAKPMLVAVHLMEDTKSSASAESMANPDQTAALMAQIELMRHGNCQLIEAIQLPDQYKGIYLNMVVNGQVSTDANEQKIAFALLKQTRCSYTPMLMANSK